MRLGIICPSEIASRRFLPALSNIPGITFVGVGVGAINERFGDTLPDEAVVKETIRRGREKAQNMIAQYGGDIFESYAAIVNSPEIDALYIPLPPAFHYKWAREALKCNKHILLEKPATVSLSETSELIKLAKLNELALHENYMFIFHNQIKVIDDLLASGEIGEIRQYNLRFGFPRRELHDFRYSKSAGGGALLDAGGYPLKYADRLLGQTAEVKFANLYYIDEFEVDIFGSAVLMNDQGICANISFGMDNDYKCELEIWGSKGTIFTERFFTTPSDYRPVILLKKGSKECKIEVDADNSFLKSIQWFIKCIGNAEIREENYRIISRQAKLLNEFRNKAAENRGTEGHIGDGSVK